MTTCKGNIYNNLAIHIHMTLLANYVEFVIHTCIFTHKIMISNYVQIRMAFSLVF